MTDRRWTPRQRARYLFESTLSSGTLPVILALAAVTLALIAVATVVMVVAGIETSAAPESTAVEDAWLTLMRTLDPGTMSGDIGWPFRLVSLGATLTGILVVSSLIGLIATAIDRKVEDLRRGRSPVIVDDHTLILGWSPKVPTLVSELVVANENVRRAHVVVLASMDKREMEDAIRTRVPDTRTTTVICRTGHPSELHDLDLVNAAGAKSIIVVSPESESPDAEVIRATLALQSLRIDESTPIVVELVEARRAAVLRTVTHDRVSTVASTEVIARIAAQICRYRGLSEVFQELLDFDGDEIYFQVQPRLAGHTFGTAVLSHRTSSVIGLRRGDGTIEICPPAGTIVNDGDSVIAISEDDDTIVLDDTLAEHPASAERVLHEPPATEHLLVLGWNQLGSQILGNLDPYLAPGSTALVVFDPEHTSSRNAPCLEQLDRLSITVEEADVTEPHVLDELVERRSFDHVIVLCHRRHMTTIESDAQALVTLLLVRESLHRIMPLDHQPGVVTELLDVHDVEIAPANGADDFIVSERLTGLMLSQLSENIELEQVFRAFFRPDGAEIAARPLDRYVDPSRRFTVRELTEQVLRGGDLLIGVRHVRNDGRVDVIVNPAKDQLLEPGPADEVIVVGRRHPVHLSSSAAVTGARRD